MRRLLIATALALAAGAAAALAAMPMTLDASPAAWTAAVLWLLEQQRQLQDLLVAQLRALRDDGSGAAIAALLAGGFAYGVLHAAGPGHGKAVLATYLATRRSPLGAAVALAAAASAVQAFVAIALVAGPVGLLGMLPASALSAELWVERASYALVAGLGAWLGLRAIAALAQTRRAAAVHDECCGPAALPPIRELGAGAPRRRRDVALVLATGLRPCTGAVLVLIVASVIGVAWAGIAAVIAMAVGTATTVAALALATVLARDWALRAADAVGGNSGVLLNVAGVLGGGFVLWLGATLLAASFVAPPPRLF